MYCCRGHLIGVRIHTTLLTNRLHSCPQKKNLHKAQTYGPMDESKIYRFALRSADPTQKRARPHRRCRLFSRGQEPCGEATRYPSSPDELIVFIQSSWGPPPDDGPRPCSAQRRRKTSATRVRYLLPARRTSFANIKLLPISRQSTLQTGSTCRGG